MDPAPDSSAWGGARWIGGGNEDLVLYAPYLAIFDVKYALTIAPGSTRASFVYGANDSRLMDKYKNIYQVENAKDQSYIKLELDISGVDGTPAGKASSMSTARDTRIPTTRLSRLKTFDVSTEVINNSNKNAEHVIEFHSTFGQIALSIDGNATFAGAAPEASAGGRRGGAQGGFGGRGGAPNSVNLNPVGSGGNYIPFGMLCDIGFSVAPGQNATFREVTVRNNRFPNNILFQEDLAAGPYKGIFADSVPAGSGFSVANGRYVLAGGGKGLFLVRNPSRNSTPMLRTTFKTSGKAVEGARLYVTARGIYEMYLNGKRVGDDYYNPGLTQYNVTHMYQTYDVTSMIRSGDNAMGAMLGEGWWSGLLSFGNIWNHFGDRQSLLAKLVITYKDGTSDVITTNPRTWKYFGNGPLVYSSLDFGEIYDAARERAVEGWTTAAYDDGKWKSAAVVPLEGTTFSGVEAGRGGAPGTPFNYRQALPDRPDRQQCRRVPHAHGEKRKGSAARRVCLQHGAEHGGRAPGQYRQRARRRQDHAAVFRNAVSRSEGIGEECRHDHDGELSRRAEPGRLHHEGGQPGLPAPVHVARIPVHRNHRNRSSRFRWKRFRAL